MGRSLKKGEKMGNLIQSKLGRQTWSHPSRPKKVDRIGWKRTQLSIFSLLFRKTSFFLLSLSNLLEKRGRKYQWRRNMPQRLQDGSTIAEESSKDVASTKECDLRSKTEVQSQGGKSVLFLCISNLWLSEKQLNHLFLPKLSSENFFFASQI